MIKKILFLICLCFSTYAEQPKDFFLITIPKSGTHLAIKLLFLLTDAPHYGRLTTIFPKVTPWELSDAIGKTPTPEQFASVMQILKNRGAFAYSHLNFSYFLNDFLQHNPSYVPVLQVRDLRDVLVSYIYYKWDAIEEEIGPSNFDDKLLFMLNFRGNSKTQGIGNIYKHAVFAAKWAKNPGTFVLHFEDIVGEQGGGSTTKQKRTILMLADALDIELDVDKLNFIAEDLFGKNYRKDPIATFRKGQIGDWKTHFSPENLARFQETWGPMQIALGYSLD